MTNDLENEHMNNSDYKERTEAQRMCTAAHEVGHMLSYMVAIAMKTDLCDFADECSKRITLVHVKTYEDNTNCGGFIHCNGTYEKSDPEAYKRMLCGGAIGEWCEELERSENQEISNSLSYFTYAAKGHYNTEQMKGLYKSCGGESDAEHLINICTSTGTTIQEETLKTIYLFRNEEFIVLWKILYSRLFHKSRFTCLDVTLIACEFREIIYSIKKTEEAKQKQRRKIEYIRNNSWVKRVWHRICRYVIKDNMDKKDTDV